ncbi:alpha-L-arabinofuranosidase 2-like, partial [Aegilops tauschii subsp. strangulata]|uniref:alpha-L-arabinofuranosidase 2-like n=1 Tax=Aegilops tauschii subsp. strangulata TaxID=200361 RepID=UPI001ABCAF8D
GRRHRRGGVPASANRKIDASKAAAKRIPETLFGLFFEEINHAGAGGIWAELVSNRGFEAGGALTPSRIEPWSILGNTSTIRVTTDRSSCFKRNVFALKMEVLCEDCPPGGVGISNPGFWDMNIDVMALLEGGRERAGRGPFAHGRARWKGFPS